VPEKQLIEEILFCKTLSTETTVKEVFNKVERFEEHPKVEAQYWDLH